MTEQAPVTQAIADIRSALNWAYRNGWHEFGYDPLVTIEASLASQRQGIEQEREALLEALGLVIGADPGPKATAAFAHARQLWVRLDREDYERDEALSTPTPPTEDEDLISRFAVPGYFGDRARAELEQSPTDARDEAGEPGQREDWRDIASAPKDGTTIDVWRDGMRETVYWGFRQHHCGEMGQYCDSDWHGEKTPGWVCSTFNEFVGCEHDPFTHWMPYPSGPDHLAHPEVRLAQPAEWHSAWEPERTQALDDLMAGDSDAI